MRLIDKDELLEKLAELIATGTLNTFEDLGDVIENMPEVDPFDAVLETIEKEKDEIY